MKIKTVKGKTIDTDKLTDADAEISEAVKNLYDICEKYNKTFMCRIVLGKSGSLGASYVREGSEKQQMDEVLSLLGLIQEYLESSTNGAVSLAIDSEESES